MVKILFNKNLFFMILLGFVIFLSACSNSNNLPQQITPNLQFTPTQTVTPAVTITPAQIHIPTVGATQSELSEEEIGV